MTATDSAAISMALSLGASAPARRSAATSAARGAGACARRAARSAATGFAVARGADAVDSSVRRRRAAAGELVQHFAHAVELARLVEEVIGAEREAAVAILRKRVVREHDDLGVAAGARPAPAP